MNVILFFSPPSTRQYHILKSEGNETYSHRINVFTSTTLVPS